MIATKKLKAAPAPKFRRDGARSSTGKSIVGATLGIGFVSHRSASWTTMGGSGSGTTVVTGDCSTVRSTGSRRYRWSWTCSILVLGDWEIGPSCFVFIACRANAGRALGVTDAQPCQPFSSPPEHRPRHENTRMGDKTTPKVTGGYG